MLWLLDEVEYTSKTISYVFFVNVLICAINIL